MRSSIAVRPPLHGRRVRHEKGSCNNCRVPQDRCTRLRQQRPHKSTGAVANQVCCKRATYYFEYTILGSPEHYWVTMASCTWTELCQTHFCAVFLLGPVTGLRGFAQCILRTCDSHCTMCTFCRFRRLYQSNLW